jgi:flagellar basal-body rod modification protein FlgD
MQTESATAINAVSRSVGGPTTKSVADYDSFLQLLVTEMRNQDPTKPMDPTQTVTQLATFSSVEQAVKTNSLLSAMVVNSGLSQAAAMIGKTITPPDGSAGGVVKSVTISDMGLVATLDDGRAVLLTPGVTIS